MVYSNDNIITIWGTRSGIPNDNGVAQERQMVEASGRKVEFWSLITSN